MDTSDTITITIPISASIKKNHSMKRSILMQTEKPIKIKIKHMIWIFSWNGVGLWRTMTRLRSKKNS